MGVPKWLSVVSFRLSEEAVAARRRFLDRGHAEPLLRAIRDMLPAARDLLDVGCGDGYYLGSLGRGRGTTAIDLAARRYPQCEWIVANADRFIPYSDASFDLVLSITSRMNALEFRRVLRDEGTLLVAVAASDDLIELRSRGRGRVARTIEAFAQHFKLIERRRATTHRSHCGRGGATFCARPTAHETLCHRE